MTKIYSFLLAFLSIGCVSQSQYDNSQKQILRLQEQNDSLQQIINVLRDSVEILSFSANQRFEYAFNLVNDGDLKSARKAISDLMLVFPHSTEARKCKDLLNVIEKKESEIEKLKVRGYKAFPDKSIVKVGDVTYSFSDFYFKQAWDYDYESHFGFHTYILVNVSMTTKNFDVIPSNYGAPIYEIIACKIVNGKLVCLGSFQNADYIGRLKNNREKMENYQDKLRDKLYNVSDVPKVNTVRYKLEQEISIEDTKSPIVIVLLKKGKEFKDNSDIEYVKKNYNIVKIINRHKL